MSSNEDLAFRQEIILSDDYLKFVRETMGKKCKPSYAVGDFNHDRFQDFAVLLIRAGDPVRKEGITSEEHSFDFPLRLVVFNGGKKGFHVAYTTDLMGPRAAFIAYDRKLRYGVFETDSDDFILTPAGKGYIMEFPKEP